MVTRLVVKRERTRGGGLRKLWIRSLAVFSVFCIFISSMAFISPVSGLPQVSVTVNSGKVVGTNKLSLGFQLADEWSRWRDSPALKQLAKDANFELVRIFSWVIEPCTGWNEATRSGTFNWAKVDSLVQRIYEVGAEPLICLGFSDSNGIIIPPGMAVNSTTGLPYPESFAQYCVAWVKHFKAVGLPVRYYEVWNEPFFYFYKNWVYNETKLSYFLKLFNTCYLAMHAENPQVLIGNDTSLYRKFLDYWKAHGGKLDFFSFHKYDCDNLSMPDDTPLLRAETRYFVTNSLWYGIGDARRLWGVELTAIASESNWAATSSKGTDPRIQEVVGATWLALVLRSEILANVQYNIYFSFSSSKSWELEHKESGGFGFGMVNLDDNQPWYPYYVQKLIGGNLAVSDQIVESTSSSPDIKSIAWVHDGKLNTLVICKNDTIGALGLKLYGLQGTLNYSKIDNNISWQTPKMQNGTMDSTGSFTINGYTVALFQANKPPTSLFEDGFESGGFSKWTGALISSGETAAVSATSAYVGSYSAKFASNGGANEEYAYCYKSVNVSEVYVRGYFNISSGLPLVDNQDRFYLLRLAGSNTLIYAGIRREGGVDKWVVLVRNGSSWMDWKSVTSPLPQKGSWVCVELHWKSDSTQGSAELYINGVKVIAVGGINTAYYGNATRVDFGLPYAMGVQKSVVIQGDSAKISKTRIGT